MTQNTFLNDMIDFQLPRLKDNMLMNRLLVYIYTETRNPRVRIRQIDLLQKFALTKYKMVQLICLMEGAALIDNEGTMEHSYFITPFGEKYLEVYLTTDNGQKMIKEIANERII